MIFKHNRKLLTLVLKPRLSKRFRYNVSYAFTQSTETFSPMTIGQLIENRASDSTDKTAVISQHQNISKTYGQLNQDANKLAKGLISIGCVKGSRVGIWAPNCYEWVVSQWATAKIGAIMVNVNPGYQSRELEYCLNLILESLEPNILNKAVETKVKAQRIPTLENLIVIENESDAEEAPENVIRFNKFISQFDGNTNVEPVYDFDDPINIQFTSGTTGQPKGATLTHHGIMQNAYLCGKRALQGLNHKILCMPPPLYHCFGSVVGGILGAIYKATLVLPSPIFNPVESMRAIQDYKCDVVYGTPTMFIDMLSNNPEQFNLSSLKRGFMTGSPCPRPLLESFMRAIPSCEHILIPYGSTECSPTITFTSIDDSEKHRLESVGRPIELIEVKVVDVSTGQLVPIGTPGEVCTRGHNVFPGYWNQEDKTKEVVDKNRWYHTGDIGVMDEQGYISINGRLKEMIIRGGENIYPREIEDFLLKHEDIVDIQIVGIPDTRLGEELVAFVIKRDGSELNDNHIKSFCKGKISHFKIPKHIEFVDQFPRTVTGKIEKYKLKKEADKLFNQ